MKNIFIVVFLSFASVSSYSQSKIDTLTNEKIIKLSKLGLQTSVIINKIQTSYTLFDVSTDALIKLSDNGVSADVINEMMKTDTKIQIANANQKDMNDPKTMRKTGIYYYNSSNSGNPLKRVDPTVTSTNSSGGFGTALAQHYSAGLAKNKVKTDLAGSKSNLQINEENPVFYFYFESNSNPGVDNWFFATASSPNEFVLVKLDEDKNSREMVIGESNAYGSSSGVPDKIKVQLVSTEIAEGIFKVTFKQPLKQGEYCFLYTSSTPSRYNNNKVFDFGILNNK